MNTISPDRPALVTGASRGLGAALALTLAERGYHVLAVARTTGGLEELDDRIQAAGGSATLAPLDITDDGAMQHLCRSVHERWGGLSLWAHTAIHAAPLTLASHIDGRDWAKSVAINLESTRRLIAYVAPLLAATDGARALFFDDPRGGLPFFGSYGTTKAAQIALARSWAAESARTGPPVSILTPNPMSTATRARFFPGEDRTVLADPAAEAIRLLDSLPQG
ncbi:SDR family oxidoreductase [Pseudoruegeria sp. SK021]|uniref:SDR family NAD(P)-dependent oxidoreductase n=1 Tax=Pseudoruegeria sp. SK021 TaxID=1933035 RepID=UPI000A24529E|nr:SDR family oxidoreductase [Pseudoruegeria sp. SK021]OSP54475.1 oxidoreductase [Pseudoruegeria sp. SK021]